MSRRLPSWGAVKICGKWPSYTVGNPHFLRYYSLNFFGSLLIFSSLLSIQCLPFQKQGLLDIKSLPSIKLQDWCKHNNRRPDFLEVIPGSFFDLVDKCLTVNPRLRISAEEALRHEFFTPCHEALRKHRLLRQEASLDSASSCVLLHEQSQKCAEVSWTVLIRLYPLSWK